MIISKFFSYIWQIQYMWSVVDLHQSPHSLSPIVSSVCEVNLDWRMLGKICSVIDKTDMPDKTACFIILFMSRYSGWLFPLLRQFVLIPNRTVSFWISEWIVLTSALINFSGIRSILRDLCLFSFSLAISRSEAWGWGTSDSAACISVYLTSLAPCASKTERNNSSIYSKYCGNLQPDYLCYPLLN